MSVGETAGKLGEGWYEGVLDTNDGIKAWDAVFFCKPDIDLSLMISIRRYPELRDAADGARARVYVSELSTVTKVELL
jgi:hypothetical protein